MDCHSRVIDRFSEYLAHADIFVLFSIVVLAGSRIVEHGRIRDLLSSETSEFRRMAAKSGLIQ